MEEKRREKIEENRRRITEKAMVGRRRATIYNNSKEREKRELKGT